MSDEHSGPPAPPPSEPNPLLKNLDVLVGTWKMTGNDANTNDAIAGTVSFEWFDGGFFLVQRVEMDHGDGNPMKGIEIIGHDREKNICTSNYFDNSGNAFQYAWEVNGNELITWMGGPGSPAFFKGTIAADGKQINGAWQWPGGGYSANMTKV